MLHLILGRAGFGKTRGIYERIAQRTTDNPVILLVPEQYSFESERAMLALPFAKRAEVLSFSRLCQRVFEKHGGVAGNLADDGEKLLLMIRALRQTAHRLQVYRRQADSLSFASHMLAVVQECGYNGITPDDLSAAADRLSAGALQNKTREIALVASAYHAMLTESYLDPDEELLRLHDFLADTDYWQDKTVYVDCFKDFTAPQKKLLKQMIARAADVTVALCADGLDSKHNLELFANTKSLANQLIRMAEQSGVAVAAPTVLTQNQRAANGNMRALEQVLAGGAVTDEVDTHSVIVCACRDRYDEAEFTAANICRLVREEGFRYRDITVLARDIGQYEGILDRTLERYDIPFFLDTRRSITHQPLTAYALKALGLGANGWDTAELLAWLKTGLCGFTLQEIADLENYAFVWNVKGKDWLYPFTHHPDGMGEKEPDEQVMERLNDLRKRAVFPVLWLRDRMEEAKTVKDYATALFTFLEKGKVYSHLQTMAKDLSCGGKSFEGEDLIRCVEVLNGVLDRLVGAVGSDEVTAKEFLELFTVGVQSADMGKIPQGIDQVVIGSADRTRPASPKAVIVLGANQGTFPAVPAGGGLFSDSDRKVLKQVDIPLSDHCEFDTVEENFLFYTAAVSARERALFTYPVSDGEKVLSPCVPLENVKARLKNCLWYAVGEWQEKDPMTRVQTLLPALEVLASRYHDGSDFTASLHHSLAQMDPDRLQTLHALSGKTDCRITPQHAENLFGKDIYLSPTGVEVYHKCAFSYFCRYGLRVSPRRPVALDVMSKGTVVHHVLEQMFNRHGSKGLCTLTKEQMESNVRQLLNEYVEQCMGGVAEKAHVFRFQLERIVVLLLSLLEHMAEELRESRFETAACELKIGPDGTLPAYSLPLPDGGSIAVVGVVDRLDTFEKDGVTYFRVVDYKTGTKTFDVEDLYYGIGLQMFLYLYAVEKNGQPFGKNRVPAGVLYMPARRTNVTTDGDEEKAKKEIADRIRMKGVVLEEEEIIRAMEPDVEGKYIPVTLKKDGSFSASSDLATLAFFGQTRKRVEQLLEEMGMALRQGNITCDPLDGCDTTTGACHYCDYKGACPFSGAEHRKVAKMNAKEKREVLKGEDPRGL